MVDLSAIFSQGIVIAAAACVGISAALIALCSACACCCEGRAPRTAQPVRCTPEIESEAITVLMRAA